MKRAEWELGDISQLRRWVEDEDPAAEDLALVRNWVRALRRSPAPPESVHLDRSDHFPLEHRVAYVPGAIDLVVLYTLDPIAGRIDLDDVSGPSS